MHDIVTDENEENSSSGTCIISRCLDDSSSVFLPSSSFPTVVAPTPSVHLHLLRIRIVYLIV